MTSNIYIASDKKLPVGELEDRVVKIGEGEFLLTFDSFFFEANEFGKSLTIHFPKTNFQVCTMDLVLPTVGQKNVKPRGTKGLKELYGYIENQMVNVAADGIEILFCLNGDENKAISKTIDIAFDELKLGDLYYEELKLVRIKK